MEAPEDYPWMSYRYYTGGGVPDWITTGFLLGCFGKKGATAREKYRHFVHDLIKRQYSSPLQATVASTILGSPEFVNEIQERHLSDKKANRDLPTLRKLTGRLSLDEIVKAVRKVFLENDRQATKAGIYMCHRYSGAKPKEIGELFRLTESGVMRASKRFEQAIERDKGLKESLVEIWERLK